MEWEGVRVLVTGGNGFIGNHLWARLQQLGAYVSVLDTNLGHYSKGVCSLPIVQSYLETHKPQVIFHLAAQTEVLRSFEDPYGTYETNVIGTLNVLEACRQYRDSVKGIIIASSDKAYGESPKTIRGHYSFLEDNPLLYKGDIYSSSKRIVDDLCHDYGRVYELPIRVLRCANTYGPGQRNKTTLITNTITRILRGEKPEIYRGCGDSTREWLYISDAVDAYIRVASKIYEAKPHAESVFANPTRFSYSNMYNQWYRGCLAYNVGSGEVLSVFKIVDTILHLMGKDPSSFEYVQSSGPQIQNQSLRCEKFRSHFPEWTPTLFHAGITETIKWYRENPL